MPARQELKNNFLRLIDEGKLSHSYLLFGFSEEKNSFANELANYLENKEWGTTVRPLLDATLSGIQIDDIREGIKFLWQKPMRSSRKVLIIPTADNMTLEAQNAILKVAEDPPQHALILLLVNSPEVLLPTIQSRFQKIFFGNHNTAAKASEDGLRLAKNFLKSTSAKRKEMLKEITPDNQLLKDFVYGLINELKRDKIKNWRVLKDLLHRWTLMNQFNTNKKLQLESIFLDG